MTVESTLMTLQSILGPNPIHNEPGFESLNDTHPKLISYNLNALYHSINFTINTFLRILNKGNNLLPHPIDKFEDEIKQRMWSSLNFLIVKLSNTIEEIGVEVTTESNIHHSASILNFGLLLDKAIDMYRRFPREMKREYAIGDESYDQSSNMQEAARIANPPRLRANSLNEPNDETSQATSYNYEEEYGNEEE